MWTCFSATVPNGCKYHANSEKSPEPSLGGRKGRNPVDSVDTQHRWETRLLCARFPRIPAQSQPVSPHQRPLSWLQAWGVKYGGWNLLFLLLTSLSLACVLAFLASSRGWATKCRLCNCSNSAYKLNAPMFTFPPGLAQYKDELWDAC